MTWMDRRDAYQLISAKTTFEIEHDHWNILPNGKMQRKRYYKGCDKPEVTYFQSPREKAFDPTAIKKANTFGRKHVEQ